MRPFAHGLFARLAPPAHGGPGDDQLLAAFVASGDEEAFAQIVRRHGPMVHAVCRRVLRNDADADDAFQATFLVFLRKAAAVRPGNMLGNFLHGVAVNVARKGLELNARRRAKERAAPEPVRNEQPATDADLAAILDQELGRLPAEYRAAVVACDLEGRTRREAAGQLGWSEGTVASRLARARSLLADRLTRRGIALPAAGIAAAVAPSPASAVPAAILTGHAAVVETLAAEAVRAMFASKLKTAVAAVVALAGLAAAGTGVILACGEPLFSTAPPSSAAKPASDRSEEAKPGGGASAWAKPLSGAPGASDKPAGGNAGGAKPARFLLKNPNGDITVVSDRHETFAEFFRRQRVMVAGIDPKDLAAAVEADKPTPKVFVNYASQNEAGLLNASYGAYVRLAPVSDDVAQLLDEKVSLVLAADAADKDVWHVVGFTTRSSVGFFTSREKKGRDDLAPADLLFNNKK